MATVVNSLIHGLSQQMVQARLNTIDTKPFMFGTYFPVKKVTGFNWRTLTNQLAKKNVAADLHTDNGTIVRKARPMFETAQGNIPFISVSREMTRSQMKDYQTELALSQDADATKLVQFWGDDVDFCFNAVQSELEYIAWMLASNAGKLAFTTKTNATFANEYDLDYQVDDANKVTAATDWSNAASADVIGDLVKIVETAKGMGINPKFAFISQNELYRICTTEQMIKACASYLANATQMAQTPSLEQVNQALGSQAWLKLRRTA